MQNPWPPRPRALALVTGASTGIGYDLALKLAAQGFTVAAMARSADKLQALVAAAAAKGGRVLPLSVDVTDTARYTAEIRALNDGPEGPIDLAIFNAGSYWPDDGLLFTGEVFRKHMALNVLSAGDGIGVLLPSMLTRKSGHLAVVASVAGYRGLPRSASYSATKSALITLCEGLRFGAEENGVKIQVICPGFVKTPLTDKNEFPMPFLLSVNDAGNRILAGLQTDVFEITFPRRFAYFLKMLRLLPYRAYFRLLRYVTGKIR